MKIVVKILQAHSLLIAAFLSSVTLLGCSATSPQSVSERSNLTSGQVSLTLKKNQTTQGEVLEKFGAPNLVTQNSEGEEVWTYQRHATTSQASSSSGFATFILIGGQTTSALAEQSTRTMTLIIKFRESEGVKKVVDFSSRYSSF